jgi:hypothetical protein
MYSFSKGDFTFLLGREVEQVCFGRYQAQLYLDSASIRIEGKYIYTPANAEPQAGRGDAYVTGLVGLLGSSLTTATVIDERALMLSFSNGDSLQLVDDSDQYESFEIRCGDIWMVI